MHIVASGGAPAKKLAIHIFLQLQNARSPRIQRRARQYCRPSTGQRNRSMAASGHVAGVLGRYYRPPRFGLAPSPCLFSFIYALGSHICIRSVSLSIQQITSYQFLLIDITISHPYSVQQTKRVGKWEFRKEPPCDTRNECRTPGRFAFTPAGSSTDQHISIRDGNQPIELCKETFQ